jgi:hypothetical protein
MVTRDIISFHLPPLLKHIMSNSLRLNNVGVDHLVNGRLEEAYEVLSLASKLNQEESYDSIFFEECGVYCNRWLSLSNVINAIEGATCQAEKETSLNIFPFCLSIEKCEQEGKDEACIPDELRNHAVYTSRQDWIIEFNLALVAQLLGVICGGIPILAEANNLLAEANNLYEQIGRDILEWYDYSATLDMALLLIAIYNNEGCIYHHMGIDDLASFYMDRVSTIYFGCANLKANPLCRTFVQNSPVFWKDECAPAA